MLAGSPPLPHNSTAALKAKSLKALPCNFNSTPNYQGFSAQGDLGQEKAASLSVISRPPPGLSGYIPASNLLTTPPVAFDDELLEEKFESYFYKKTRSSEFSWIGKTRKTIKNFNSSNFQRGL